MLRAGVSPAHETRYFKSPLLVVTLLERQREVNVLLSHKAITSVDQH
jgi:hypothetical protein